MKSDLAAALQHLEQAFLLLDGCDEFSEHTRAALDVLIDAVITAEFRRAPAEVISMASYRERACAPSDANPSGDAGDTESRP